MDRSNLYDLPFEAGDFVLVKADEAGVTVGFFAFATNHIVVLNEARKVWEWRGANTTYELSLRGASMELTRITEPVRATIVADWCEIIPCTAEAQANLTQSRWFVEDEDDGDEDEVDDTESVFENPSDAPDEAANNITLPSPIVRRRRA